MGRRKFVDAVFCASCHEIVERATLAEGSACCVACVARERSCRRCGVDFVGLFEICDDCEREARRCSVCRRYGQVRANVCSTCRSRIRHNRMRSGGQVPVSAREYAVVRASGACVYCNAPATHADHIRPLSRGGAEHISNLVPACKSCNLSKGARLLTEWRSGGVAFAVARSSAVAAEWRRLTDGVGLADLDDDGADLLPVVRCCE